MKNILNIVVWLLLLPFYVLISPYLWYRELRGFDIRLNRFLTYGRVLIGGYHGKLKIGTTINNVIYQTENFDINGKIFDWRDSDNKNINYLLKMRVYNYWVEDDYLFIKVFKNDKLIEKHKKVYDN